MPILDAGTRHTSQTNRNISVVVLLLLLSLIETAAPGDIFYLGKGYTLIWLMLLYLVGGHYKMTESRLKRVSTLRLLILYFLCAIFTVIACVHSSFGSEDGIQINLMTYTSPTAVIMAVILLELFLRLERRIEKH